MLTITITYDTISHISSLPTGEGFSCLIRGGEKNLLFDSGAEGKTLLYNIRALVGHLKDIDIIFLSHNHSGHIGGLWDVLEENPRVSVCLPSSVPVYFRKRIEGYGARVLPISEEREISKDFYSTGEMGGVVKEQALVIKTKKGLVLITGCAHPGIVNIAAKALRQLNGKIYLLLGGFHLAEQGEKGGHIIVQQLKGMDVEKVAPSYCTGRREINLFEELWGENFINVGCGRVLEIEE